MNAAYDTFLRYKNSNIKDEVTKNYLLQLLNIELPTDIKVNKIIDIINILVDDKYDINLAYSKGYTDGIESLTLDMYEDLFSTDDRLAEIFNAGKITGEAAGYKLGYIAGINKNNKGE